jgi:hypothetical protein
MKWRSSLMVLQGMGGVSKTELSGGVAQQIKEEHKMAHLHE